MLNKWKFCKVLCRENGRLRVLEQREDIAAYREVVLEEVGEDEYWNDEGDKVYR